MTNEENLITHPEIYNIYKGSSTLSIFRTAINNKYKQWLNQELKDNKDYQITQAPNGVWKAKSLDGKEWLKIQGKDISFAGDTKKETILCKTLIDIRTIFNHYQKEYIKENNRKEKKNKMKTILKDIAKDPIEYILGRLIIAMIGLVVIFILSLPFLIYTAHKNSIEDRIAFGKTMYENECVITNIYNTAYNYQPDNIMIQKAKYSSVSVATGVATGVAVGAASSSNNNRTKSNITWQCPDGMAYTREGNPKHFGYDNTGRYINEQSI
jgi:hypothetical protein